MAGHRFVGAVLWMVGCGCTTSKLSLEVRSFGELVPPTHEWTCKLKYANESDEAVWMLVPRHFEYPLDSPMFVNVIYFENLGNGGCLDAFEVRGKHCFYAYPIGPRSTIRVSSQNVRSRGPSCTFEAWIATEITLPDGRSLESLSTTGRWRNARTRSGERILVEGPDSAGAVQSIELPDGERVELRLSVRERYRFKLGPS